MGKTVLLCAVAVVLLVCSVPVRASSAVSRASSPRFEGGTPSTQETPHGVTTNGAEAEASKPGLFSGTFADSLWTVVAFVTLVVVLTKVAWKPLLAGLNARQNHIEQQLKSAEGSRQRAEQMLDDYKQQGQTVIRQATDEAQRHRQQTLEQTREEVLALRRRAHEEVESAQAAAMEDLWKQTGEIVLRVGSEVLGRTLTPQDNQRLIDEAVTRIKHDGGL